MKGKGRGGIGKGREEKGKEREGKGRAFASVKINSWVWLRNCH